MLLQAQANREPPLGPPPDWMQADAVRAWHEIRESVPDVLRARDGLYLSIVAMTLAESRRRIAAGPLEREWLRLIYRMLGDELVPMAARRRLIFGDTAPPSRSRRV